MIQPPKTEAEQLAFFSSCYEKFLQAKAAAGEVNCIYRIGNTTVRLMFAGASLVPHLTPALEHLRLPQSAIPDLTLCIWDSTSTATDMVPPPCQWEDFTDRGDIWGFHSHRIKTAFHWSEYSVNLLDCETNTGLYWVKGAASLPYWAVASPLRTLFHWWMEKNGCQLLHAAAVGTETGAVLITGKGGVGKSTTALSCLQAGMYYLADDYLIARLESEPLVYSLYSTAKVHGDHLANLPAFSRFVHNSDQLELEKAVIFLRTHFDAQIVSEMSLKAILVPEISEREETRLTPVSPLAVQRAISFTTMAQLPGVGPHTHDFIRRLVETLPGYKLELGRHIPHISTAIADILRSLPKQPVHTSNVLQVAKTAKVEPLISVIIPVFNGERFLKEAIDSVLSQHYPAIELIIVDDGSTDNTAKIIEQLPVDVRAFTQENTGPASARNRGIRDTSGAFIAFLDVDDLWPANTLHMFVEEMARAPDVDVMQGYAQLLVYHSETGNYEYSSSPKESYPYYIGAGLYRKSVFSKVGLFDATLQYGEDTDWFIRAQELNVRIKRVEDVTLFVRRHGQNMTHGKNLVELNTLRVFKKALDRSRAQDKT